MTLLFLRWLLALVIEKYKVLLIYVPLMLVCVSVSRFLIIAVIPPVCCLAPVYISSVQWLTLLTGSQTIVVLTCDNSWSIINMKKLPISFISTRNAFYNLVKRQETVKFVKQKRFRVSSINILQVYISRLFIFLIQHYNRRSLLRQFSANEEGVSA